MKNNILSTKTKLLIIGIIFLFFAFIIWKNRLNILCIKDRIIYTKTDEEHSFKPTWNKMELIEKSTTSDDSVCIVSDITKDQKKNWNRYNEYAYCNELDFQNTNSTFVDHIQRISSTKFAQLSYTYKKPFIFAKPDGYKKEQLKEMRDYGDNFGSKMMSLKFQIYDIDKKKQIFSKELIKGEFAKERDIFSYGWANGIKIYEDKYEKAPFIIIQYGDAHVFRLGTYCRGIDKNGVNTNRFRRDYNYNNEIFNANGRKNWMDIENLGKLLKGNGVDIKGVMCLYNYVDYNDFNMIIKTESLPKKDAYLYKVYPKLKKYIGQKGKLAKFYLKGLKNSDEIVSYFLPEGQKVSYGYGVEVKQRYWKINKYKEKTFIVKSLEEYNNIVFVDVNSNVLGRERLSYKAFGFK